MDILKRLQDLADPERGEIANLIRTRLGLKPNEDPLDPKFWPIPAHGQVNTIDGEIIEPIPLVRSFDDPGLKGYKTLPVTPFSALRNEGAVILATDPAPSVAGTGAQRAVTARESATRRMLDIYCNGGSILAELVAGSRLGIVKNERFLNITDSLQGEDSFILNRNFGAAQAQTVIIDIGAGGVPDSTFDARSVMIHSILVSSAVAGSWYLDSWDGIAAFVIIGPHYSMANFAYSFAPLDAIYEIGNLGRGNTQLRFTSTFAGAHTITMTGIKMGQGAYPV